MPARLNDVSRSGGDRTQHMYYVYVLKSTVADFYYKGFCENLEIRLEQHNRGITKSNKAFIPFKIIYYEICEERDEAVKKERYWKSAAGRRYLKNKIH